MNKKNHRIMNKKNEKLIKSENIINIFRLTDKIKIKKKNLLQQPTQKQIH